jgi:hypothetical protein
MDMPFAVTQLAQTHLLPFRHRNLRNGAAKDELAGSIQPVARRASTTSFQIRCSKVSKSAGGSGRPD